jgi:ribonuclease Z
MILLGVGTAVPDIDRECTHMVWDGPGGPLLVDAAGNTYTRLQQAGVDPQGLKAILLTHSHADHVYGFPILLTQLFLAGRTEPITVYGLPETFAVVQPLVAASQISSYMLPVEWVPIAAGESVDLGKGYTLRTAPTEHSRPCIALRFEGGGKALVCSADTRPCESVAALAAGADVLIHEATEREPSEAHTTPQQAGEVAARAGVGRLVIVHFSPRWTMPEEEALAAVRAGGFAGRAEIGREQQVVDL